MSDQERGFFAISNNELAACEDAHAGDVVTCRGCGDGHELQRPSNAYRLLPGDVRVPIVSDLLFYSCPGGSAYLGAIAGKLLPGVRLAAPAALGEGER